MAEPAASPLWVINPNFCAPSSVDLEIVRKVMTTGSGDYVIKDGNGNIMFNVEETFFSMHQRRVLLDAAGNPISNSRQKVMTAHGRCEVFRGDCSDAEDLLFTAKLHSLKISETVAVDVFLANNKAQEICDFKVEWFDKSCLFYAGESSTVIAQMHRKHSARIYLVGNDKFLVTVNPNIDYAFIVALVTFLDDINSNDRHNLLLSATTGLLLNASDIASM